MTSSPSEVGRITLERVTFRYLEQSKRPVQQAFLRHL